MQQSLENPAAKTTTEIQTTLNDKDRNIFITDSRIVFSSISAEHVFQA
jgi:hypothetical protein